MAEKRAGFQFAIVLLMVLTGAGICAPAASLAARSQANSTKTEKREAAQAQFARAEEQRSALNGEPAGARTLAEYKQVVSAYRRVALITPRSADVPESLLAIGELYGEMGDRFGSNYYQSAVDTYQFLLHEYPANRNCPQAMLRVAGLQRDQLNNPALAAKTYEDFLKRYPRAPQKREVQESLAELALLLHSDEPVPSDTADAQPAPLAPPRVASAAEAPRPRNISGSAGNAAARITIDLDGKAQFTSARIGNPDRIFFDLTGARLGREAANGKIHVDGKLVKAVRVARKQAGVVRIVFDVAGVKDYTASLQNNPPRLTIDFYATAAAMQAAAEAGGSSGISPAATAPVSKGSLVRGGKAAGALNSSSSAAQPTRDGQDTLTRTLGLKIGRIVIDAGHGGHDTGTIGPTGLMEKDLCLDVALRLANVIHQRLPGAEVVFTRSDDTFIPLEERTSIANNAKADLFLSIHANSSQNHAARGVETYYLNLKGSPQAMEVAARENSTGGQNIHDLQDLVQKIARNEKIDESRELATDVQDSLAKRVQSTSKSEKDRGVRKAPFVVLIGANMPSILAEISFLSNPADEKLLKKPEQRQKVAEGLYQGVANYLRSLNSVTNNLPPRIPGGGQTQTVSSPAASGIEQSRNRQ